MASEPCVFDVGEAEEAFNDLLTTTPIEGRESYSVMRVYDRHAEGEGVRLRPWHRVSAGKG